MLNLNDFDGGKNHDDEAIAPQIEQDHENDQNNDEEIEENDDQDEADDDNQEE